MFNKKSLADTTARRPSTGAQAKIYSRDNVARYSERARQRRRSHTIRHVALIVVLGVLLSATTAAGLWFATIMGKLGDS
ncbi:MAG: LytR family transcriptional regulator, partial [Collinsella sp.]